MKLIDFQTIKCGINKVLIEDHGYFKREVY